MSIPMPDLTVEVYNSVYRVLSQIPWQEAIPTLAKTIHVFHLDMNGGYLIKIPVSES